MLSDCTPASGCTDIDQDIVALVGGRNALLARLLVQGKGPIHVAHALTGHQQAPVSDLRRGHVLRLHLLKHLHSMSLLSWLETPCSLRDEIIIIRPKISQTAAECAPAVLLHLHRTHFSSQQALSGNRVSVAVCLVHLKGSGEGGSCVGLDTGIHVAGVGLHSGCQACVLHALQDSRCAHMVPHLQHRTALLPLPTPSHVALYGPSGALVSG